MSSAVRRPNKGNTHYIEKEMLIKRDARADSLGRDSYAPSYSRNTTNGYASNNGASSYDPWSNEARRTTNV